MKDMLVKQLKFSRLDEVARRMSAYGFLPRRPCEVGQLGRYYITDSGHTALIVEDEGRVSVNYFKDFIPSHN